jgi:CPA1 family monovalent cation:H+ antiporter
LPDAGRHLAWASIGGLLIGWLVGIAMLWVRRKLTDPTVQATFSLVTPFAAYLPAEAVGASGVLAVVTTAIYISRYTSRYFSAEVRTLALSFWLMIEFLLNGLAFILIGLQLRRVYFQLEDYPLGELLKDTGAIALTVIVVRILWVFPAAYLPRWLSPSLRRRDPIPPWQELAVIGWAGIRGVDSLATALAIPLLMSDGTAIPHRNLVIFLSFGVILSTLVLQGLSLPVLIRWLKLRDDELDETEEMKGRAAATEAALRRLDELANESWIPRESMERIRATYRARLERYRARLCDCDNVERHEERAENVRRLRIELLKAERQAVIDLRDQEVINDEVMRDIERDIDLEELRIKEDDLDHDHEG